jgi:homoserine kinase
VKSIFKRKAMRIFFEYVPTKDVNECLLQDVFFQKWRSKILEQLQDMEVEISLEKKGASILVSGMKEEGFGIFVTNFSPEVKEKILDRLAVFVKKEQ